jgi:hypothetical protein
MEGNKAHPIEETENWYPAVSIKNGLFSDIGMRFRLNIFDAKDEFMPGIPSTKTKFFDMT